MRILMLGWEFPPFISGGLGTACYGLTRALDRLGHEVLFVLPRTVGGETAQHVELVAPDSVSVAAGADRLVREGREGAERILRRLVEERRIEGFEHASFLSIPSPISSPYGTGAPVDEAERVARARGEREVRFSREEAEALREAGFEVEWWEWDPLTPPPSGQDYAGDVVGASRAYATMAVRLCRHREFDVIHAHDWMTYPAGMALARITGKPLVTHIHSTEFDRSGEHVNQPVYDIERRGMHAALRVIAVSALTKKIVCSHYGVEPDTVDVVYNGIETADDPILGGSPIEAREKIVLFLGRITMQKGPEYFIAAAKRVLDRMDNVRFLVAGSGDMARRMIELAAEMGIGHKILFTGFLRGKDVERVFQMADLYVMPSVSEPFGIAPLEAITNGTPALISKQSGVSEVLQHVLKVDFWDVDEMANKIIAVLRHPVLHRTLSKHGHLEVRSLTWEGAAQKCAKVYENSIAGADALTGPSF